MSVALLMSGSVLNAAYSFVSFESESRSELSESSFRDKLGPPEIRPEEVQLMQELGSGAYGKRLGLC